MLHARIDHIVVVAPSLAAGSDLVFEHLGIRPLPGGTHPRMGTHNLLLRLGESSFLEVLAMNPGMPGPLRPRWFGIDEMRDDSPARLACWVARTHDIHESALVSSEAVGSIEPMSRGSLEWLISVPPNGDFILGGAGPALIQWPGVSHPAASMKDLGCSLATLDLLHPEPARVSELLASLHFSDPSVPVSVLESEAPGLVAHIDTPHGRKRLGAPWPTRECPV